MGSFAQSTSPAKAGVQLGDVADVRCERLARPSQLGPGLRRGGEDGAGRAVDAPEPYNPTASLLNSVQLTGAFP
ncbi:hypothetical protein HMP09_1616 [Sphingomonas sp. HMP9]|nr:hypothetical protein HMP09_1616 [Sphingomonas sp. HMP9]